MTWLLMVVVAACLVVIGLIYRFRRDVTGTLTPLAEIVWWTSIGALFFWVAMDWLTHAGDRWFTTPFGGGALAAMQLLCLTVMLLDTFRVGRSAGRHRAG